MIRINLLPFRAARKRENIKRQITVFILCVVLVLCGFTYFYLGLRGEISDLQKKRDGLQAELSKHQATLKKITQLEKKTKELKQMLNVIRDLEKAKTGPVMLLDEIASAVPKGKLFLTSLKESKGILTLSGTAMDNETVALFMTRLKAMDHILDVDLNTTRMKDLPKYGLRVSEFELKCKTYIFKEEQKVAKKSKRKRRK
ncbi:MAG: PilN domain-containing protein [Deltaproteobacteria bacterium]|nr:PilN domain-containing protein [Deltaproteobacteria bacterium]MBW2015525.1 PilN domain-containing protein [Deltaproteobacteria bacterium]MBW2128726.1 PilN domain-containing protein [Deltaproteobacteria bacterium]MBW2302196.1 PilN domain-containing protein [Deltaproteobacteria bacterium]